MKNRMLSSPNIHMYRKPCRSLSGISNFQFPISNSVLGFGIWDLGFSQFLEGKGIYLKSETGYLRKYHELSRKVSHTSVSRLPTPPQLGHLASMNCLS